MKADQGHKASISLVTASVDLDGLYTPSRQDNCTRAISMKEVDDCDVNPFLRSMTRVKVN